MRSDKTFLSRVGSLSGTISGFHLGDEIDLRGVTFNPEGREVLDTFVEIETGKGADALDRRPNSPRRSPPLGNRDWFESLAVNNGRAMEKQSHP
jgi:hypothetical protein